MKGSSKIIIYDDGCPLCAAYTSAFVVTGLINERGRKTFSNIDASIFQWIDKDKCHNEIPLIDPETKEVWYGVDAILELLSTKTPFIKSIGNSIPVKYCLQKMYKFISYNRKVIVATSAKNGYDCSPDFNVRYRLYFLAFFLCFNTWMLEPLFETVFSNSIIKNSSLSQLHWAHFILVSCNITVAASLGLKKGLEYAGQVNMLALTCVLLLVPLHIVNINSNFVFAGMNNFYLGLVCLLAIKEYIRRMKYVSVIPLNPGIVCINIISILFFIFYLLY